MFYFVMFKFNIDLIIFIIEIENWLIKKILNLRPFKNSLHGNKIFVGEIAAI